MGNMFFNGEKFTPDRIDIDTANKLLFPPSQTLVILEEDKKIRSTKLKLKQ